MKNRHNYPKNWRKLARACKERAAWRCEECSIKQGSICISRWTGKPYTIHLQAAHKHHDPHNETPELVAVCAYCHWHHYRRPGQRATWMERRKHAILIAAAQA